MMRGMRFTRIKIIGSAILMLWRSRTDSNQGIGKQPTSLDSLKDPKVRILIESAKSILNITDEPQIIDGGTHARKLKNAIPFGSGILSKILNHMRTSEFGGSHGINEAVEIQVPLDQIKVYVLTLIRLDQAI
jgi:acetylornithine deacetylase/succinyl-diaminopimelate desuccinylase-like protein